MKNIYLLIFLFLMPIGLSAQSEKLINPSDLKQQTIITEPLSLPKGFMRAGLAYAFSALDKYFDAEGEKKYSPESTWGTQTSLFLLLQYGITNRFMVELDVPYRQDITTYHWTILSPADNLKMESNMSTRGRGLSDMYVSTTYQIIPSEDNKFSMKASADLTIPTGRKNPENVKSQYDYDAPTGYGVFVITPRIQARLLSYPYSFVAYIQYSYNFTGSRIVTPGDIVERHFKYGNNFYAGGGVNLHLNEWIALTNDLVYSYTGRGELEGTSSEDLTTNWSLAYEPRIIFQIRKFRMGEAVNVPIKGKLTGADPQYVLLIQYVF